MEAFKDLQECLSLVSARLDVLVVDLLDIESFIDEALAVVILPQLFERLVGSGQFASLNLAGELRIVVRH